MNEDRRAEQVVAECSRCGAQVRQTRAMIRRGERALLGVECGCFPRWLHWRELREFEDTGVI